MKALREIMDQNSFEGLLDPQEDNPEYPIEKEDDKSSFYNNHSDSNLEANSKIAVES
jgi:hypothetical protein